MPPDLSPRLSPLATGKQIATLADVLRWRARCQPDQPAFTFLVDGEEHEERLTYAELDRRARAIAGELRWRGATGERALMVYDAGLDYVAALYGCLYAGVIAVPVYPPDPFRIDRTLPRLQAIVADARAAWLLSTRETLEWAGPLFAKAPGLVESLATDIVATNSVLAADSDTSPHAGPHADCSCLALLQYTSGSTGAPRGVMISHGNMLANLTRIEAAVDREGVVAVSWLPAYHDMGLIGGVLQPVYSGRHVVMLSPVSFMQRPYRWLWAIDRFRATTTAAPNFAYDLCVRKISPAERATLDLSCWKIAINGAETVRSGTIDRFSEAFAECGFRREAFYPCYGLAEATLMVAGGATDEPPVVRSFQAAALEYDRAVPEATDTASDARQLVGCGRAVRGQQIEIVDIESRRALGERRTGEIWVRGASIGQGYWGQPEETAVTFQAYLDNGDGPFLRTGDLGFFDRGELFITGRLKDLIIIAGRNHYPNDIERTVADSHPSLKLDGGAAFSIELAGEERLAIVQEVSRPRKADFQALIAGVRSRVAEIHDVPVAAVALIPAGMLPKTSSGKTRRRACRELFLAGALGAVAEWRDPRFAAGNADNHATQPGTPRITPPRTETEYRLAEIWGEVLGVESPNVNENFFDLGGQSLLAGQLAARVGAAFQIDLPIRTLFESPTVAGLAAWLDAARAAGGNAKDGGSANDGLPPLVAADRTGPLPLSSGQEQLWFLEQLQPEPRYELAATVRLQGPLDEAALRRSLDTIARRHEALRTVFPARDGQPSQLVLDKPPMPQTMRDDQNREAPWGDLQRSPVSDDLALIARRPVADFVRSRAVAAGYHRNSHEFRHTGSEYLAAGPLLQATLQRRGADDHLLSLRAHHLVCDGWSLGIFMRELAALYTAEVEGRPRPLPTIAAQYADFAAWQRRSLDTPRVRRQLDYWKNHLSGIFPLELTTDFTDPTAPYRSEVERRLLPRGVVESLARLARGENATLYMALLAAFQTLLARYSRQDQVCVGSPVSYRPRREFEETIGYFVQTLPLASDLSGNPDFRQLLGRVREVVLSAFANQDAPLSAIVDAVAPARAAGRSPLFNVMFVFENLPWRETRAGDLTLGDIEVDQSRSGTLDLALVAEEREGGLQLSFVYNAALFERGTVEQMLAALETLLRGIVAQPDGAIMQLPLVDKELASRSSAPLADAGRGSNEVPATVTEMFVRQAQHTPEAIAIIEGDWQMTYRELDRRSNRLANDLTRIEKTRGSVRSGIPENSGSSLPSRSDFSRSQLQDRAQSEQGVKPQARVAVYLERSTDWIVAWLAVFKAGAVYVPFDADEPPDRLAQMLEGVQPQAIITTSALAERLPPTADKQIVLDRDAERIALASDNPPAVRLTPSDVAYIVHTSGSTGRPKGVEVQHGPIAHLTRRMAAIYELTPRDRMLQLISPGFDVAAEEVLPALVSGATVVFGPAAADQTGRAVLDRCRGSRVTIAHLPTILWQQVLREWEPADDALFAHLRIVVTGGEAAAAESIARWHALVQGRTRLLHEYGLTEATVTSLIYELPPSQENTLPRRLPIGRPIAGVEAHVLDVFGQPVPGGAPGELYLGGAGLAYGYHGLPEATAERFINHPVSNKPGERLFRTGDLVRLRCDGELEFLGRVDAQIKLRGFRIEPAEVERALLEHPAIRAAAVIAREDTPGVKRLVAYITPINGEVPGQADVREWLRGRLPAAMLPSAVVRLDRLPMNSHHKLDRSALPVPEIDEREAYVAPRDEVEKQLAAIWQELLGVAQVGIDDNFFELGGDSILGIQMISRARQAGLVLHPRQLLEHQTIGELAACGGAVVAAEQGPVTGGLPLTPIQHWFLDADPAEPHHFNQAIMVAVADDLAVEHLPAALEAVARHHDALRLRFRLDRGERHAWHAPPDDNCWPLETFDLSKQPPAKQQSEMASAAERCQTTLDLERGPTARAAWFHLGKQGRRLLLVAHHLTIDAVSWPIVFDDLLTAWRQVVSGIAVELPAKTTSFQRWARRLVEYAQSAELQSERPWWQALAARTFEPLPDDSHAQQNGEARTRPANADEVASDIVTIELGDAETSALLERANQAYRTRAHELLLAALVDAIARWANVPEVLLDIEGHGRTTPFDDIDLSRTVGWFTAAYPVALRASAEWDAGQWVRETKESLRNIPGDGIGYGVLQYLSGDADIRAALAAMPAAEIAFNYLGRLETGLGEDGLSLAAEPTGPAQSPRARRRHAWQINAFIKEGRLRFEWAYCRRRHHRSTIERLAADFRSRLERLIGHCCSPNAGAYTPSDFPLARLSQGELDTLAGLLGEE